VSALAAETEPILEHEADGDRYTIRRYRPGDKQRFLELHDSIDSLQLGGTDEWFDWKFADPPAMAHEPIFLATHRGEVVGARPFVPFRLRAGPRTLVGIQTADTMVHPDHRRRGLFSRMNELAFSYYRRREPELMFSIPNGRSRPAYLDLGARVVSPVRNHLRIEAPSALVADKLGQWVPDRTVRAVDHLASGYLRVRDRNHDGVDTDGVTVERRAAVPSETLAALGEATVPDHIHVRRDRQFYDWRFANPEWDYESYVATRGGEPIAALVAGTNELDGQRLTRITEAVPLSGERRLPGLAACLDRLLETDPDREVVSFAGTAIPSRLLRRFGFHPDDELPLAPFATQTVLITLPLAVDPDEGWTVEGYDVTDPDNWQLPFAEQNTG
jgi:GNAT superfamily N-acetyltransferase